MVVHTDLNCLSVMQFAVDILKVKHIIVVGHYGCSGVQAAMRRSRVGLADNWLRHVQDVHEKHQHTLDRCGSESAASDRLCELNVIEQVAERLPDHASRVTPGSAARNCTCTDGSTASPTAWRATFGTTMSDFREAAPVYSRRSPNSSRGQRSRGAGVGAGR